MLPPSSAVYTIQTPPPAENLEPATQTDEGQKSLEVVRAFFMDACIVAVGKSMRSNHCRLSEVGCGMVGRQRG
jgi:hypothetical protein